MPTQADIARRIRVFRILNPADDDTLLRAMAHDGHEFQDYWTKGKGLKRWVKAKHPWRKLRDLLAKHTANGVTDPDGLASKYFHVVHGFWPGEREGRNKTGPG